MAIDRDRLMRAYAPRLAPRADALAGPQVPGGVVKKSPDSLGGLLDVQVVGDIIDGEIPQTDDDPGENEPAETDNTGVMVALFLPDDIAEQLALTPGQPGVPENVDCEEAAELHLTLAYLGTAGTDVAADQLDGLAAAVQAWAAQAGPLDGVISGIGVFNNEDTVVTYATFDAPALPAMRQRLVDMLAAAGFIVTGEHGFTPHITLTYGDARGIQVPHIPVTFTDATLAYGGDQMLIPLGPSDQPVTVDHADAPATGDSDAPTRPKAVARAVVMHTSDRQSAITPAAPTGTTGSTAWNPVITSNGAKTVITGPATTERAAMWGAPPNPNRHMLWMQGRFVGGERPNRNGAFWSTSDLQVGQPTVAHGPLNWLHEERHVIGAIADAQFMPASDMNATGASHKAAATTDPHITALAAIWQWIYPTEASVVQMASDAGVLAYSMECVAQAIQCTGDNGCGQTFDYMQVAAAGGGCDHLKQHTSVHRLVNPIFLGGAVIVPPTRPGWADADASVMKEAASMAEVAYEQAGRPDIPANIWEQMMTGVVAYTKTPS